jgi:GntR family transcriptional regulator, carbon starvation induced regulator
MASVTMSSDGRVTRATLMSQVEDAVRWDIVSGELAPGQRLRAAELIQKYGVSATPLREALQRLAAQKLIDWDPRLGAAVADVSLKEVKDIYWLREVLEALALSRSIERADDAWDAKLDEAWAGLLKAKRPVAGVDREVLMAWSRAHRTYHEALLAGCDSDWLVRFNEMLSDHSERYRVYSARVGTRDSREEHESIYTAAKARDVDEAVAALRRHLESTVTTIEGGLSSHKVAEPATT